MLFAVHAEQARCQTPLSGILWTSDREELRVEPVGFAENLPVQICAECEDELLVTFLEYSEVPNFLLNAAHARDRVV